MTNYDVRAVEAALCSTNEQVRELIAGHDFDWYYGDPYSNSRCKGQKLEHKLCYQWDKAWEEEMERVRYIYENDAWNDIFEQFTSKDNFEDLANGYELTFEQYQGGIKLTKIGGWLVDEYVMNDEDDAADIKMLRVAYRVLERCDEIFSREFIEAELTYQVLWQRGVWEEERREANRDRRARRPLARLPSSHRGTGDTQPGGELGLS